MQILRRCEAEKSILQAGSISMTEQKIKQRIKKKGKAEKMSGFRMFAELLELLRISCSHNPETL